MANYFRQPSFMLSTIIILCCQVTATNARSHKQFQHFFPAWDPLLRDQLANNCSDALSAYLDPSDPVVRPGYMVIDCILNNMPEFRKAELAAAAVILGLAPSVLQLLSASYLDTAILAYRRPVLASLLSMASSGVRPLTATDYDDMITTMGTDPFHTNFGKPRSVWAPSLVSLMEYIIALGAVANNAHLTYQLCIFAVCTFAPAQDFLPAIWAASAVLIHLVGYLAARLRVAVEGKGREEDYQGKLGHAFRTELTPTPWQRRLNLKANKRHTGQFLVLVSILYVGDALQALFGTLILSSLVFISVRDSAIIVIRLMGSALFARLVLIYELAGFRTDKESYGPSEKPLYSGVPEQNERFDGSRTL
ncbi:hypothetical protein F53441_4190 [Fusarium austroafricanum]|uniref:Uncharacterized protein n=1 Tax=Fusarium austroafricanum TaxID=2364996 RepID=A0A8H4KNQ2_9HYPO|nr:hypothetical protein F53441_4190 [Fusarium austroafricanum]